jgi:hypothetical protein
MQRQRIAMARQTRRQGNIAMEEVTPSFRTV